MAKVSFKITTEDNFEPSSPPINGQITFVMNSATKTGKIYVDFNDERICYTPSGINYLGIVQDAFDPTKEDTWKLNGKTETFTPNELDMVVHGTKEYLFRSNGWHEIGDENAPEWNT